MELLGGLLVLLAMVWCGATICAGGLCTDPKEKEEQGKDKKGLRRDQTMKRQVGLFVAVVASGFVIGSSAFAGQLNALGQWTPTSTQEGRKGWTAVGPTEETGERAGVSVAVGERGGVTRVTTRTQAAAVESEPTISHPALVPFSIGGR